MTQPRTSYARRGVSKSKLFGRNAEQDKIPLPPPLKPFDIKVSDLVKIYDSCVYKGDLGEWRLCDVVAIYPYIVACRDLRTGTMTTFRILDYRQNDGVRKVVTDVV